MDQIMNTEIYIRMLVHTEITCSEPSTMARESALKGKKQASMYSLKKKRPVSTPISRLPPPLPITSLQHMHHMAVQQSVCSRLPGQLYNSGCVYCILIQYRSTLATLTDFCSYPAACLITFPQDPHDALTHSPNTCACTHKSTHNPPQNPTEQNYP